MTDNVDSRGQERYLTYEFQRWCLNTNVAQNMNNNDGIIVLQFVMLGELLSSTKYKIRMYNVYKEAFLSALNDSGRIVWGRL